ncbi:Nuclear transport factor 2 family protein (plasmid) [Pararobbsia alpina]|uniref:nuclear transport factor 2 family protein n=1 Tax=Pararobbsia alpina TaxID=621374 RepID=UPI0039A47066
MTTARELFQQFTESLQNPYVATEWCLALFADDAVFEFPYAPTLGLPARYEGKEQIGALLEMIRTAIPPYLVSHVVLHDMKSEAELFVEYRSDARVAQTGARYSQDYASYLVAENGKIKVLREYFNAISSARAILPGGLESVPAEK